MGSTADYNIWFHVVYFISLVAYSTGNRVITGVSEYSSALKVENIIIVGRKE